MITTVIPNELVKPLLLALNQLYDIEKKLALHGDSAGVSRNVQRMKDAFGDMHLFFEDPMGQPFNETRTDVEASIAGDSTEGLRVTDVIKPIVRFGDATYSKVVQKGIVVVRSDSTSADNEKGEQQ